MANIIDGIDVSGCGFIHEETGTECHIALAFSEEYGACWHCEQIENCYYKQLKRAEIFNKELCKKFNEDMTNLLQENEKLKNMINKSVFLPNIEEQATNKFRQALMEIREECIKCENKFYPDYYDEGFEEEIYIFANKLSNKIDEVLNDR